MIPLKKLGEYIAFFKVKNANLARGDQRKSIYANPLLGKNIQLGTFGSRPEGVAFQFFPLKPSLGPPLWRTGSEHVVFEAHSIKDMNLTLLNS